MPRIRVKRIYDAPDPTDGFRVLVDGLWPRGLKRGDARIDLWAKNIAPTPQLRRWFAHDPDKWTEFQKRYRQELADNPAFSELRATLRLHRVVTLLYGARSTAHNHALVLQQVLQRRRKTSKPSKRRPQPSPRRSTRT